MTRYRWVDARKAEGFPTTLCCRVARVSRQAFYGWQAARGAGPTDRERAEAALVEEIREIHAGSDGTYGSPRVTAELRDRGRRVNRKRVERLMRAHNIAGIRPRRPKRTTTPARSKAKLPDLLRREFSPGAPDRAWCSDITYIRTGEGWLYLAVVLDVGSRRLLGYAMSDRIDTRLVQDALDMAGDTAGPHRGHRVPLRSRQPVPRRRAPQHRRKLGVRPVGGPCRVLPSTTPAPNRSSPASNENSSIGAATPTGQPPAARSSSGSPATTPPGATPASTVSHRTNTKPTTVTPREPPPPYPPDRSTGGSACPSR